eukprot:TRINITY_DN5980_c0_g1_i3.p1 TRINITY_DN5980_c0_g1~~TRINITY_DN5980_c0_g1_i3.p1  ORF type:complete len:233 (-),score=48.50 TRINITY_DN5980_c0_g1_i3:59-757(-)
MCIRDSPQTVVYCPYRKQGCGDKMLRCEVKKHLRELEVEHACMLASAVEGRGGVGDAQLRTYVVANGQKVDALAINMQKSVNDIANLKANVSHLVQTRENVGQYAVTIERQAKQIERLTRENQQLGLLLQQVADQYEGLRSRLDTTLIQQANLQNTVQQMARLIQERGEVAPTQTTTTNTTTPTTYATAIRRNRGTMDPPINLQHPHGIPAQLTTSVHITSSIPENLHVRRN